MSLVTSGMGTNNLVSWGLGGVEIEVEAVERPAHIRRKGGITGLRRRSKKEKEILVKIKFLNKNETIKEEIVISNLEDKHIFAQVSDVYVNFLGNLIPINESKSIGEEFMDNPISAVVNSIMKVVYKNND